jgi:hypothetical protein
MDAARTNLPCDGCGFRASPEHIAERLRRLEIYTRYRPVHISMLFVALAPSGRIEDDFYGPPESKDFFEPFLTALNVTPSREPQASDAPGLAGLDAAKLAEFQHRGYYLACLSECPIPENGETPASTIARLAPTLIRRIRFNYKPKLIAPIGQELYPLVDLLRREQSSPVLTLDNGQPLPYPRTGGRDWQELFQRAVASAASGEYLSAGYDRIQLTGKGRELGAGGKP